MVFSERRISIEIMAANGYIIASFLATKRRKTTPKAQSLRNSEFSSEKIVNIKTMKTEIRINRDLEAFSCFTENLFTYLQ